MVKNLPAMQETQVQSLEKEPTPVFLPREFHGQRSLVAIVHEFAESDTTECLTLSHQWNHLVLDLCLLGDFWLLIQSWFSISSWFDLAYMFNVVIFSFLLCVGFSQPICWFISEEIIPCVAMQSVYPCRRKIQDTPLLSSWLTPSDSPLNQIDHNLIVS